jgi:uncharacterized repeat protein (TIGR03806 family)
MSSRNRVALVVIGASLLMLAGRFHGARGGAAEQASSAPAFGLGPRVPWTTSRVAGSPDPPDPFVTVAAYPNLKVDRPVHLTISPDGKRWFITREPGLIDSIPVDGDPRAADPFLDARIRDPKDPKAGDKRRLWSMAFHPRYAENGYVYVCYLQYAPQPNTSRVVRYTVSPEARKAAVPACDPATEALVCEWPAGQDHFGGCLAFGPDGMLYFSAGDGSPYADGNQTGQNLADLNASLMRIDVDRGTGGKAYAVPADNPFVALPGARPEVWAYGLRNVWKFSIDQSTGDVWAGDVGQDLWEPAVRAVKGGNYGWSVTEGTHSFRPARPVGPTPVLKPVWEHEHSEARSITGGYVYRGKRFPELAGQYVYGDYETGKVWALGWDGRAVTSHRQLVDTPYKLVAFGQDADGELVLLDYQGTMHRLARNPAAPSPAAGTARGSAGDPATAPSPFPRRLSETGLFASTQDLTPAVGVIPYDVNSPLWSDGAQKQRYLAVPGDAKIKYAKEGAWGFPDGSVLVKTFSLDTETGNPASRRRLETRILHIEQGHWRGYTYVWDDDQTDATLLEDPRGSNRTFAVKDPAAPGGVRQQTWHFPSRAECTLCHTMPAGFVLGLETRQMNRDYGYPAGDAAAPVADNQIRALEHAGLFDRPVLPKHGLAADRTGELAAYNELPRLPNPKDPAAPLADRARSYLHANCSHCHRKWGGGNALFELTFELPLDKTKTVDVAPQHGEHGVVGGRLIRPGDPSHSLLLHRMLQLDETRMPRAGSTVVDIDGVELIRSWLGQM